MNKHVLVIEDDKEINDSLRAVLEFEGYDVSCVESVESAMDMLDGRHVDLVLTDVMLGGMSGVEGITLLKYRYPNVAVIVMTAYATVDLAVDAMKRGADEFLTKPFDMETLAVSARKVLKQHEPKTIREERNDDLVFGALANPIRRAVIKQLKTYQRVKFMDLCRLVNIDDHTKFNFHLRQLINSGIVKKLNHKEYTLTELGKELSTALL